MSLITIDNSIKNNVNNIYDKTQTNGKKKNIYIIKKHKNKNKLILSNKWKKWKRWKKVKNTDLI